MNKLKKIFTIFLLFVFLYLLFKYSHLINVSVIDATNMWLTKVFPSLFIMFVLNDLIINTGILEEVSLSLGNFFNKIFNTKGISILSFILSMFSGTPSSAFILKEMLLNNSISLEDANKLIAFTYFSNPLFLYNILSLSFNKFIIFKIIIIHYLSNILVGLFFRGKKINQGKINNEYRSNKNNNIFLLLPKSITKSFNTLLVILGTITFYMIITNLIITILPLNNTFIVIIKGILEITQSLNILPNLNILSIFKEIIAIAIISFGGLSIHTQVLSIINDTKISYKNFFIGRILHTLFSTSTYLFISFIISG